MDLMLSLISGGIIAVLLAAILPLLFIRAQRHYGRRISLALLLIGCISLLIFSINILLKNEAISFSVLLSGIPMSFVADRLSAFFVMVIALISIAAAIYSFSYVEHIENHVKRNFLAAIMSLFILSMVLVVLSHHLLAFMFFWEIMSVSSFFLVMFDYEKKDTQKAGIFYFVMTQLSTVFLLIAFIAIYKYTGSFEMATIKGISSSIATIIFLLLFIGFGIKAGMIPFHKWLPYAHPSSPSQISALMSGVMIKIAIYGMIRFLLLLPQQILWIGIIILIAGTTSAFLGVIYALKEHDLKRLLAYHSIENIGIIIMAIGLYVIFNSLNYTSLGVIALGAALFHTLNHALFKSILFLTAGSVVYAVHSKNIEEMGGLIKSMPYTAALFLIGAVSISALPPLNGFVSELMIFQVLFQSSAITPPLIQTILFISLALLAMTSALAAACFVKAFGAVFLALPRSEEASSAKEVPIPMIIGPAILALCCILLGVFSYQILSFIGDKLGYEFPTPNLLWLTIVLGFFALIVMIIVRFFASRKSRVSETWGCGIPSQNSKMEYTASGFSEPIVTVFSSIYRTKKSNKIEYYDSYRSIFKSGIANISLLKFFEEYLYLPIVNIIEKISLYLYHIQNRIELDSFVLYSFITIIALMIIAVVTG